MPWRFKLSLATVFFAATSSLAFAQGPMQTSHAWAPSSSSEAMIQGCPPGGMSPGWGPAYPPAGGQYIGGGPRQVQPDIFYDSDSPIDLVIAETLRRSWMRVEYIGWNIKDPGNRLLGAEMDTLDARVPFQAFDPGNVARTNVNGVVQDTGDISFDNLNGMRLTFGAPTQWGSFEADVWGVISGSQTLSVDPVFDPATLVTTIPAVTMTVNGAASDTSMILFDNGYDAELRSGMWGAQGNWIANPLTPQNALVLSPVVGIRYVKFNEELRISGSDLASGTNPRISSKSNNNVVGPQVGFRASMDSKWFSMGLEPKVMFAINRHQDTVRASDIWDSANGDAYESKEDTDFAPGFNLPAYAKVHLGENFSVFAGYELLWLSNVSRPTEQIVYDSPAVSTDPAQIGLKKHREQILAHGFMFGGEFRFR